MNQQGQCILFSVVFTPNPSSHHGFVRLLPAISLLIVSPVWVCLTTWWERFPGTQKEDECGGPLGIQSSPHCKDAIPKIRNKYSQKRNCGRGLSVLISTCMCLWAIYVFPRRVWLFCYRKICGLILGIYKYLTDTWMWWMWKLGRGRAIPFQGIQKLDFRCSVVWVYQWVVVAEHPLHLPHF